MTYMLGVGGGSSGGTGLLGAASTAAGGGPGGASNQIICGAGGGSGALTLLCIPTMFLPDVLYVQAGDGGAPVTTSAGAGLVGTTSLVYAEPVTSSVPNLCYLFTNAGPAGGAVATSAAGGAAGAVAGAAVISNMPMAGVGIYNFFSGQVGAAGGAPGSAGTNITLPVTGLCVTGSGRRFYSNNPGCFCWRKYYWSRAWRKFPNKSRRSGGDGGNGGE